MGQRHTAKVCENGHILTNYHDTSYGNNNSTYCGKCGAATMIKCNKCDAKILGGYISNNIIFGGPRQPDKFCNMCGVAYPWTERSIQRISEIIDTKILKKDTKDDIQKDLQKLKDKKLDDDGQRDLVNKIKLAGKEIWEIVKPALSGLITEAAKKQTGL